MTLDPALFRPEAIDPETAVFVTELEQMLAAFPSIHTQTAAEVRAARAEGRGWRGPIVYSDRAKERAIPGPAGEMTLRTFVPRRVEGAYLHFHAGGWTLGSAREQDPRLEALADACNVAVLSAEYRLAPEQPYPAGPDDCEAAALWLAKNARSEFGTERLVIGGESGGAHLAVVTLLRLRDHYGLRPFAAADLCCGAYDLRGTPSVRNWGERNLILSTPAMDWFFDNFVPPGKRDDPDVSPLLADLSGLPPALFTVGTLDPLLDDSLFMHARWLAAGNDSELAVYPGGLHMVHTYANGLGRRASERQHAFVRAAIAAT